MCGIAGQLNFNSHRPVVREDLEIMAERLAHRGPDDQGVYLDGNLGLAHLRLSILDLSAAGHQPMSSADRRFWITYNGEVYNYQQLRRDLEAAGYPFRSHTDTEVVVALFQKLGEGCLLRLEGMFAFAIWDKETRTLFLARDPLGIKPLYYYQDSERFLFASEIKAILAAPGVPKDVDFLGLHNFFAHGHSTAPLTIYRRIQKLRPGHWILVRDGRVTVQPYWNPRPGPDRNGASARWEEKASELRQLLTRSVHAHLVSDVPVGVFLSGGLDSSALVALMAQAGARVKTFSVGFKSHSKYNELDKARMVANHFGTDHHELMLDENDLRDSLEKLVYYYDEPFGDPAAFPTYFVSRLARQTVKVCLSGEGADELFGGYRRYMAERYSGAFRTLPTVLRSKVIPHLVNQLPRSYRLKQLVRTLDISDPVQRQGNWQMVFTDDLRYELFKTQTSDHPNGHDVYDSFRRYRIPDGTDGLNGVLFADVRSWLADCYLEKVDKASMAVGLEARVPFLDRAVVEFALQLPADQKVKLDLRPRGRSLKRLFGYVLRDLLPAPILNNPKHGFAVPLDPWFRATLSRFLGEVLLDDRARRRGYFNMPLIERLWNEHRSGRETRSKQLWLLAMFELWHRAYIDRSLPMPRRVSREDRESFAEADAYLRMD